MPAGREVVQRANGIRQGVERIAEEAPEQGLSAYRIHASVAMRPVRPLPSVVLRRCE